MQISKIDANSGCQPLKQSVSAVPLRDIAFKNTPVSIQCQAKKTDNMDVKYDFACRLAAFYKKQYESLKTEKSCYI